MIAETTQSLRTLGATGKADPMRWREVEFEAVFLEHYGRVVSVLLRLVGDRTRAEELANDTFWKLYRTPGLSSTDGQLGGWLYRTATNLGIDALRTANRRRKYEDAAARGQESNSASSPLEDIARAEQRHRVRATLAVLKPAQAQILILRASGFSYNELASVMELSPGGIGTTLNRAQAEFRRAYLRLHGQEKQL